MSSPRNYAGAVPPPRYFQTAEETFDPLLDKKEVCALRRISNTGLYIAIKEGRFPPGIKLGPRTVRWQRSVVIEAINKEIAEAQKLNAEREAAMSAFAQRGVAKRRENRLARQQGGAQ